MRTSTRRTRSLAFVMALGLIATACGSSGDKAADTTAATTTTTSGAPSTDAPATSDAPVGSEAPATTGGEVADALATEGKVEIAAGTVLNLDECPDDWNPTQGVDGDEIRIGISLPQSGQLAAQGQLAQGMKAYFDYINATDPIDGKQLVLVARDDGYEAGRAVANVEEMIETEDIFAFSHMIGTPINAAVRPILAEACTPQLFSNSGFPVWGDPANFPWTTGSVLSYVSETQIWCKAIADEFGKGATVAGLFMNNDFGKTYQGALKQCEQDGLIKIVGEAVHDPAAPDVSNEMTTLIATGAQVFVAGTTGSFCSQSIASVAASKWRPAYYMSYTCFNLAAFIQPVAAEAGKLAAEGSGVRMTNAFKICGDPAYTNDPAMIQIEEVLKEYGDVSCADGTYSTGVFNAQFIEAVLRDAASKPGGLNRVNLMAAAWNADFTNDVMLGGTLKTDGVNDAYFMEIAEIQEIQLVDDALTFVAVGDPIDLEGQGGSYQAP